MGRRLMIAGAGADTPAATAACAIAFAMAARGMRVGVMKPVETGCAGGDTLEPVGARALALAASCHLPIELICPCRYRAALPPILAAKADRAAAPSLHAISSALKKISAASDAVVVDASGGIELPLDGDADYADLAASANLELVLVAAADRTLIERALLSLRHAKARALRLAGVIGADIAPGADADDVSTAALTAWAGASYLGRMRFREPLKLEIIERLL
jgi:dethiobiotin synthetase